MLYLARFDIVIHKLICNLVIMLLCTAKEEYYEQIVNYAQKCLLRCFMMCLSCSLTCIVLIHFRLHKYEGVCCLWWPTKIDMPFLAIL